MVRLLEKTEPTSHRGASWHLADRVVRAIVWSLGALVLLLALPGILSVVWAPACRSCHNDSAFLEQTEQGPHSGIACLNCHGSSGEEGSALTRLQTMYGAVLPVFRSGHAKLAVIGNDRCLACHESVLKGVSVASGLAINHEVCAADRDCVSCHAVTAHGMTLVSMHYDMNVCLTCHARERVSAKAGCNQCHRGQISSASSATTSMFRVIHGNNWKETHGLGNPQTCAACHESSTCEACHGIGIPHVGSAVQTHAAVAKQDSSKCNTCHRSESFCIDCHRIEMPHPTGFLQKHSSTARTDDSICSYCHIEKDCTDCHEGHVHPGGGAWQR